MGKIYNCWQCKHYSGMNICEKYHISVYAPDPICKGFEPIPGCMLPTMKDEESLKKEVSENG